MHPSRTNSNDYTSVEVNHPLSSKRRRTVERVLACIRYADKNHEHLFVVMGLMDGKYVTLHYDAEQGSFFHTEVHFSIEEAFESFIENGKGVLS